MSDETQVAAPVEAVVPSESPAELAAKEVMQEGAPDTPETVVETDEQKNEQAIAERQKRSEAQKQGIQRRFNELTHDKKTLMEQNQALTEILRRQHAPQAAPEQPRAPSPPTREQFPDYEAYIEARAEFRAAEIAARTTAGFAQQFEQRSQVAQQQAVAQQVRGQFEQRLAETAKADPEFAEVMANEDVRIPVEVGALLHVMPDAPAIMKALHQNPALAERLWQSPVPALALGEISASLRSASPQVSKAPAPGRPVGSKPSSTGSPPEDAEAYMEWADKQMRRR